MRSIITLASTTPTNTTSRTNARSNSNYVSNLNIVYSDNINNNYDSCTSTTTTTTSQQLDDLLFELSKEAGFKSTKNYKINNTHNTQNKTNKRSINTISNNSFNNNHNNIGIETFRSSSTTPTHHPIPTLHTTGYYSDADVTPSGMPVRKHVIDLELGGRKKGSSGRIHEKVTTNQKYLKEEYVGSQQQQYKQHLQQQYDKQQLQQHQQNSNSHNNQSYSSAIHKSINNNHSEVSHKYHDRHGYGEVNIAPIPPPRKHVISPSSLTPQQFDSLSAFNSYRLGRFETTNTDNLSPPLEVKGIEVAEKESEDESVWERRRRENKSVDRLGERFVSTTAYNKFRSGSLDIDLDDLVQRNLTNKASMNTVKTVEDNDQGAYYISGIERPAVRTKNLPHTKYIFKICSPESEGKLEPQPTYSSHITIPEPAPIDRSQEATLAELESNLKDMLETNEYKEEKTPEPTPQKLPPAKEECEVISLEPIGPGVQLLEPEGSRDGRASASRIITRSLSATNRAPETPNNNHLATTNYAAYDSFYRKQQQQPVVNEIINQQALDNFSSYKKNETMTGFPNLQQEQQLHQLQQQWIQQQQNPLFVTQPVFIPFNAMPGFNNGNGSKEYKDTFKYSETHSNVPSHSLPCSPIMNPKLLAITNNNTNHASNFNNTATNFNNAATNFNNTATNFNNTATHFNYNPSNFFNNTSNQNSSMQRQVSIPIIMETQNNINSVVRSQQKNNLNNNIIHNNSNNNTISGYSFSESKQHTYVDNPTLPNVTATSSHHHANNAGSPETIRSWTVSPGSSLKTNMASSKGEVRTEVISSSTSDATHQNIKQTVVVEEGANAAAHDNGVGRVKDTANAWHRPHITRAEAVALLKNKPAGSFIVRNSQSYSGGYGLALKVNQLPPNVEAKGDDFEANFVRHFLIESSTKGVKLKGCSNEPVFGSLSALIHQHTITPLSLPCKLLLPHHANNETNSSVVNTTTTSNSYNVSNNSNNNNNNNNNNYNSSNEESGSLYIPRGFSDTNTLSGKVVYIDSLKTESMSDQEAFEKAINSVFSGNGKPQHVTLIDMKINGGGVVMTDNKHKSFFRRHYPLDSVSYCAIDSQEPIRTLQDGEGSIYAGRLFGFIAKNQGSSANKSCHLFLEFDSEDFSATNYLDLINKLIA